MEQIKQTLTPEEQELATTSNTGHTGIGIEARVVTELYVAHRLREMTDLMIESNRNLSGTNTAHTAALVRSTKMLAWWTALLTVVAIVQAVIMYSSR